MSMFWAQDPTRVAKLTDLWHKGVTTTKIAAALGTTRNSVIGKSYRLGLPRRRVQGGNNAASPEKIAIAKNLRSIGLSYNLIAKRLGVTTATAIKWVAKETA